MLESLKKQVLDANLALETHGLVLFTWGNVSAYDEETSYVVIKPSGVKYADLKSEDMVVVDLEGHIIEGALKPSSDTMTHLELYKAFKGVKAIVHTHSRWATIFAQAKRNIPPLGTTHADYFKTDIFVTRPMTPDEINEDYEKNTGSVIIETYQKNGLNPLETPAVLVSEHGPFVWGNSLDNAVHNAVVLEYVAHMAHHTLQLRKDDHSMQETLLNKHYNRKHGKHAYYGQKK
ncbi:MAG: L-ribulose-5-phosphate 4-epimerase [Acholeplasmataceae bacterium]